MSSDEEIVIQRPKPSVSSAPTRMSKRSRQSRQHVTRNAALEEMVQARASGQVHHADIDSSNKPVYEEVDEKEYLEIVKKRQEDDFVVDDDGGGYVDHGVDIFDDGEGLETYGEPKKKKPKTEKRKKGGITDFYSSTTSTKKDENAITVFDDPEVNALLEEMEFENPLKENEFREERENKLVTKPVVTNPFKRPTLSEHISPAPVKQIRHKKVKKECGGYNGNDRVEPAVMPSKEVQEDSLEFYDDFVLPETTSSGEKIGCSASVTRTSDSLTEATKMEGVQYEISEDCIKPEPNDDIEVKADSGPTDFLAWDSYASVGESELAKSEENCAVADGVADDDFIIRNSDGQMSLKMFWLDAFEDPVKHPGTVYLFGRVKSNGVSESCCVVVKNILQQVFFLPRESHDYSAVYKEVHSLLTRQGVKTMKCKPSEKKFAYNDGDIPKAAMVLEVLYPSTLPNGSSIKLASDLKGETFSHVFNTTATALERLLLETDMRGPCWLQISGYSASTSHLSYTEHEFSVNMERMNCIQVLDSTDSPPTIRMLTMNITTVVNDKKENEIAMISCIYDPKCTLERPTTATSQLDRFCFLAKPSKKTFPFDLKTHLKQNKLDGCVNETSNERHLLSLFLCKLQNLDPDAYLGHDMTAQLSLLVSRLEKLGIKNWSCVSRLKNFASLKQLGRSKAAHWELTAGRFVLDSRSSSMELVKSRSYDLTELVETLLGLHREPIDEIASCFSSSNELILLINQSFYDAWLSLSVIVHLNALPLFFQITGIVGGVLSRTVMGGRAERNEYLLLHAFYKNGYVAPNKFQRDFKKKKVAVDEGCLPSEEDLDEKTAEKSSKKAQYSGGLVLEPKKGLYDTYVLLLDFNSLYPSIIQEYNICFTTVDQSKKMESDADLPDLPEDCEEGILPREIRVLVDRRREVKKLMKAEKLPEQLRKQYDIRQMGLKLTANSMYGCLGFIQSRFYAKPLAALITSQGREILMHTKDLVEKQGYSVIYGDTDSIMIDTGLLDLEQVKKLGYEIKRSVNKCHKRLELDLDGVYKRLLLLKKKKYVGLAVDLSTGKVKREMKGLDIVRRDWSVLAKEVGNEVVDVILADIDRDEMVEKIRDILASLKEKLSDGAIDISKFEIFKQLTRSVDEYGDLKAQPHVAVAKRLNETGKFHYHRGDTVAYIICEDGSGNSAMQRAYSRIEIAENQELKLDVHYYLVQQVHPVVSRLCEPIEGIDAMRIAEALGLDPASYRNRVAVHAEEDSQEEYSLSMNPDYSICDPFTFRCPFENCCGDVNVREPLVGDDLSIRFWVDECPSCSRKLLPFSSYLINQLTLALTSYVDTYYSPTYICDDVACAFRSRRQGLKWSRDGAHCPKCSYGIMRPQFTAKMLFLQESFYRSLFDLDKSVNNCKKDQQRKLTTRPDFTHIYKLHNQMLGVCDSFLKANDYNRVSLSYLFANMNV